MRLTPKLYKPYPAKVTTVPRYRMDATGAHGGRSTARDAGVMDRGSRARGTKNTAPAKDMAAVMDAGGNTAIKRLAHKV